MAVARVEVSQVAWSARLRVPAIRGAQLLAASGFATTDVGHVILTHVHTMHLHALRDLSVIVGNKWNLRRHHQKFFRERAQFVETTILAAQLHDVDSAGEEFF